MTEPNYSLLPEHMRGAMRRWIQDGLWPGGFLTAVLQNDLVGAAMHADQINRYRLFEYADFLYNEAPRPAWGSVEATKAWAAGHIEARELTKKQAPSQL